MNASPEWSVKCIVVRTRSSFLLYSPWTANDAVEHGESFSSRVTERMERMERILLLLSSDVAFFFSFEFDTEFQFVEIESRKSNE